MKIEQRNIRDLVIIKCPPKEETHLAFFTEAYAEELFTPPFRIVVLDMEDVTRFFSTNIKYLVRIKKMVESRGAELVLVNVIPRIFRVLEAANLLQLFRIYDTEYDMIIHYGLEHALLEESHSSAVEAAGGFLIEKTGENNTVLFRLSGALTEEEQAKTLSKTLSEAIASSPSGITLDFSHVDFIASVNIAVLVRAYHSCRDAGIPLKAVHVNDLVADVFQIAGIEGMHEPFRTH